MKKRIALVISLLLTILNVFCVWSAYDELTSNYELISKEVTIIDKYSIGHTDINGTDSESNYMKGIDSKGNYVKIPNWNAEIGDIITVYQNKNSANANGGDPEWFTSEKEVKGNSQFAIILFTIFSIITFIWFINSIKELKNNIT